MRACVRTSTGHRSNRCLVRRFDRQRSGTEDTDLADSGPGIVDDHIDRDRAGSRTGVLALIGRIFGGVSDLRWRLGVIGPTGVARALDLLEHFGEITLPSRGFGIAVRGTTGTASSGVATWRRCRGRRFGRVVAAGLRGSRNPGDGEGADEAVVGSSNPGCAD